MDLPLGRRSIGRGAGGAVMIVQVPSAVFVTSRSASGAFEPGASRGIAGWREEHEAIALDTTGPDFAFGGTGPPRPRADRP